MRVQAYRCSADADGTLSQALSTQTDNATSSCPVNAPLDAKASGTTPSNGWLSRTAALTEGAAPRLDTATSVLTAASAATADCPSISKNIFHSQKPPTRDAGDRHKQAAKPGSISLANGHATPEGGVLVASSAAADSHCGVVIALALCGGYVCSAGGDAMIKVWKAGSLEFVR